VEAIATRELGLQTPAAQRVIVIEPRRVPVAGAQLAKELGAAAAGERN
jgi:hypothetical protein